MGKNVNENTGIEERGCDEIKQTSCLYDTNYALVGVESRREIFVLINYSILNFQE